MAAYVTLFSLLACTGLRICEALALARDDADLAEGVITVRAGKGGKPRLVPLHQSALKPLRAYVSRRDRSGATAGSTAFSRTDDHDRLTYAAVRGERRRRREAARAGHLPRSRRCLGPVLVLQLVEL